SGDGVRSEVTAQRHRSTLVEQHQHRAHPASGWRLCWVCSSTASTCWRVTPGNQSKKSSMHAPSSRFSKSAFTGTRVPRNTQAPLTFPGARSTAGQDDQSNMGLRLTENLLRGKRARTKSNHLTLVHSSGKL